MKIFTTMITTFAALLMMALTPVSSDAQSGHPVDFPECGTILSFENGSAPAKSRRGSSIGVSDLHSKLGDQSLSWKIKRSGARISFKVDVPYLAVNPDPRETSVSTFVFWVYSPSELDGSLNFSFRRNGRECCSFDYRLGFTGWRGAWVAFDRDMQGKAEEGMDEIVVTAKGRFSGGKLYLDGIIPSAFEDVRHHTADFQAPFINAGTTSHWLILNESWNKKLDMKQPDKLDAQDVRDMEMVRERFIKLICEGKNVWNVKRCRKMFEGYGIHSNPDGTVNGKPVFFTRYGETYINLGIGDASKRFGQNGQLLRAFNDNMLNLALTWHGLAVKDQRTAAEEADMKDIEEMYLTMTRHILDQGFAAGSAQGTLHHLGYSMRNFYTAPVIMKEVLEKAGLADEVQRAMEWFSGVGEVKTAPSEPGMDIDAFNTSLMGRIGAILMLADTTYKYAYLKAAARWIDNGFSYADGLKPCFKIDGTVMHHRKAYPAYATGGFDGAVNAVWMFSGTAFAISPQSHAILRDALIAMKFYCNGDYFPLAMSGRHPDGKGALIRRQYKVLADAGLPDDPSVFDSEIAAAPDSSPEGVRVFPFNCSMTCRGESWVVTIAGHSRYLWAAETYQGANMFGRYLTHGSMEVVNKAADGAFAPGFSQNGWNWCRIPGTTAAGLPMESMKSDVRNVDEFSGYEEMLLSDQWFAGGVSHSPSGSGSLKNSAAHAGLYAMILHEHDKYNGSLRARKSFFCFGDRFVCLGSDIHNSIKADDLCTTLFQNSLTDSESDETEGVRDISPDGEPACVLSDRYGNQWIVRGQVEVSRGLQKSLDEETCQPTSGRFETAVIPHPLICSSAGYEYMLTICPDRSRAAGYEQSLPYKVVRRDSIAHIVSDRESGITGCAFFCDYVSQNPEQLVKSASPSLIMYSLEDDSVLNLSVSNPDLGLYSGPSDEQFDEMGRRIERSVYGRSWIDNDCSDVELSFSLKGLWTLRDPQMPQCTITHENGTTYIHLTTSRAQTETLKLERVLI